MKLLRTIRLDPSDTFVFEPAAEPGEWAVPGGFAFFDVNPATLEGKAKAAFRSGFLGLASLGWSTLAQIVDATEADRLAATDLLAKQLVERFGAPDLEAARAAAADELAFATSLAEQPVDTLVAMHRTCDEDGIRETFRALRRRENADQFRAFTFLEVEGEEAHDEGDVVDLAKLSRQP